MSNQRQRCVVGIGDRLRDLTPHQRRHALTAVAVIVLLAGSILVLKTQQARQADERRQEALATPITTVTALGRLEPEGEVINVAPWREPWCTTHHWC